MRFFNTAGPIKQDIHYCVPPLERWNLAEILDLIDQQKYFILHAPRQTGKTSSLLALRDHLNAEGRYRALYVNVECGQSAREDVAAALRAICGTLASRARTDLGDGYLYEQFTGILDQVGPHGALTELLSAWTLHEKKPVVLFIDEIDALIGDTLISVLRQIRGGYDKRPQSFPQSIVLCGVRDIKDYRIHATSSKEVITGGSAFNIKAVSLRLGDFVRPDVEALLAQHTSETGQVFEPEAIEAIWTLTNGQPWLVNALAYEACFEIRESRDRKRPITADTVHDAKERLILSRATHLDQLTDKLQEERVKRVIQALLAGEEDADALPPDDIQYVRDLGLIAMNRPIRIANPIYREVIPRDLTWSTQEMMVQENWYILPDGSLDLPKLLAAFQQFFRENSEAWIGRFDYREAGPQLLLQAFLQRVINGGGRIEREYGLGMRRTDLFVLWKCPDGTVQRGVIEMKLLRKSRAVTVAEGLAQTAAYADRCDASEAHLIVVDRTTAKPWSKKISRVNKKYDARVITVWGM